MKTVNYVVLAGLLLRPRSGYDLARWMEGVAGHFFSVGHSTVYPALADLERRGFVAHEVVPSEKGPERKVYSPTSTGREALLAWTEEPAPMPQIRDEGLVKALCFGHLPEGTRWRCSRTPRSATRRSWPSTRGTSATSGARSGRAGSRARRTWGRCWRSGAASVRRRATSAGATKRRTSSRPARRVPRASELPATAFEVRRGDGLVAAVGETGPSRRSEREGAAGRGAGAGTRLR